MNIINRLLFLVYFSFFICLSAEVNAQGVWTKLDEETFELNSLALKNLLANVSKKTNTTATISFPDENGNLIDFIISDNSLLPERLAIKYPNIHAYKGVSIENKNLSLALTCNSNNIAVTLKKAPYIWTLQQLQGANVYIVSKEESTPEVRFNCSSSNSETLSGSNTSSQLISGSDTANKTLIGDNTLRILRLAVITDGEYATYFINKNQLNSSSEAAKKAAVLAAIATSINNINAVFEIDLGVRFELVENNDELIFLDPDTDPFTSTDANALIDLAGEQINSIIGLQNIDIGHMFSGEFYGRAEVASLCQDERKAEAISGTSTPEGTGFDFTLLAHEFGHQLGADHTQNYECARSLSTAVEPGSGSTIMGYAGIPCNSANDEVQTTSDEYFHYVSINQIKNHIQSVSCGFENIEIDNNLPVIEQLPNYTIPAEANFILEATTTDADNDSLTYCWEQLDNEVGSAPPTSTSLGPLFRSMEPTTSPSRNFPEEYDTNTTWEVLPTVSREMNFGLTVRDGSPSGVVFSSLTVNVVDTGEKFEVISPLGGRFPQNSVKEIQWNVAGTNANGINTENVTIELSYDGGNTFPVILAESTPNDGSQNITLPVGNPSEDVRIKITPVNNIYYTISGSSFSISEEVEDDLAPIPNPVEKTINIQVYKLQVPEYEFTLYDVTGKLLIAKTLKSNPLISEIIPVDVSYLVRGIYLMKLVVGSQIYTRKIVKL